MSDVLLIFSLGPVQNFLAEARRAQDLWAGSRLLSDLAREAIHSFEHLGGKVVFPADPKQPSLPNKFVVQLQEAVFERAIEDAKKGAQKELIRRAGIAKQFLERIGIPTDDIWDEIWQRQTAYHLEFFWSAARMEKDYKTSYDRANRAFEAAKRTRVFPQVHEDGPKDSLSGQRSALHTRILDAREYWRTTANSTHVTPAMLKPDGRERLDALGATKRFAFSDEAEYFHSVSSVAVADFLEHARNKPALNAYRQTIDQVPKFYRISEDKDWPYDGDLLFIETLDSERLRVSYGFNNNDLQHYSSKIEASRMALRILYETIGRPSPYYAILIMDGDSVGKRVAECSSEDEHADFSRQLVYFAGETRPIVKRYWGNTVYAGGDDILALLSLRCALPAAKVLATTFVQTVPGGTASAGIALVHHLHPLDAALKAAREAERKAKGIHTKDAVCVRALKRSGELTEARSHWSDLSMLFEELCHWFADGALSSRFSYEAAANLATLKGELVQSELKRLIRRHRDELKPDSPDPEKLADRLATWSENLPNGAEELGRWLLLICFIAQGGE